MSEELLKRLTEWARSSWPEQDSGGLEVEPIEPDGSSRLFVRVSSGKHCLVALANPDNPPENLAWHYLAAHLKNLELPVARVLAHDLDQGFFLMQDLGGKLLHDKVLALAGDQKCIKELYLPVLAMLARLQARGAEGFDTSVCFDGVRLSPEFLYDREAEYFLREFVCNICGLHEAGWPHGLKEDLTAISRRAGEAGPQGMVHRDFQSRNLVWGEHGPGLVDFQGARLGPAQYDLASLLHDPYVDLDWSLRLDLKREYLTLRRALGPFDADRFNEGWPFVSASRVMQALGAYGFLTGARGKTKFGRYMAPALASLAALSRDPALAGFRAWRALISLLLKEPLPK